MYYYSVNITTFYSLNFVWPRFSAAHKGIKVMMENEETWAAPAEISTWD